MLPKGLKQLLVASENLFFNEVSGPAPVSVGGDIGSNRFWQPTASRFGADGLRVGA
jgi:hypothetical protein